MNPDLQPSAPARSEGPPIGIARQQSVLEQAAGALRVPHNPACGGDVRLSSRSALMDAAYEQYRRRLECDDHVDLDQFCSQFPDIESMLRRQIEIHHLIDEHPSLWQEYFDEAWPQPGDQLAGFRLLDELGRGSFSRVYQAEDTNLGNRVVAVKVCRSGAHEAWILGKLEHDNIVPVFSIQTDMDSGWSLICMPFLGCRTLEDAITTAWRGNTIPTWARQLLIEQQPGHRSSHSRSGAHEMARVPRLLRRGTYVEGVLLVGLKMTEALSHAHGQGILHLDLKPSNVLLGDEGLPRILDFNLGGDHSKGIPRLGGTLPYMSPEQARCFLDGEGAALLDARSDLFSLGVLLHQMLSGELPFQGESRSLASSTAARDLYQQQMRGPITIDWPRLNVDDRLGKVVQRCLALDPGDRYQSAKDLARDLRRELRIFRRGQRWVRSRRRAVLAGIVITLLTAAAIVAGFVSRAPYPEREFQQGIVCLADHEYRACIDHLTHSLDVESQQPAALFARARAWLALESYHDAIRDLVAADLLERTGETCALLGYCCNRVDSQGDAVSWYDRALENGYSSAVVYNNLGVSHFRRQRYDSALRALNVAVETDPALSLALQNRAMVSRAYAERQGLPPTEAMRDIENVVLHLPCSADTYYFAASIYAYASSFDTSMKEQAIEYLRMALDWGTPVSTVTSDSYLAPLYEGSVVSIGSWDKGTAPGSNKVDLLLNPLE